MKIFLEQFPLRKIAPNPKTNVNPNPTLTLTRTPTLHGGQFYSGDNCPDTISEIFFIRQIQLLQKRHNIKFRRTNV